MAKCFSVSVVTAEGSVLEGRAEYAHLETEEGSVGILANHAPMLCALCKGTAGFRMEDGAEKQVRLSSGIAKVRDNRLTVLTDRAEVVS